MKKRFYKDAAWLVVGSSLLSVLMSVILFITDLLYRDGGAEALVSFVGYTTDVFNALAMFIGFGTIIYAFFKFDFYEGVMSCFLFAGSFIPYFIYHTVARVIYTRTEFVDAGMTGDFDYADAILMSVNQAMGSGVINQILPAILIAFITCKVVKMSKNEPTKFISLNNKLQKAMIFCCIALASINILMFFLTGILPSILGDYIFLSNDDFFSFVGAIAVEILKLLFIHLIVAYASFMFVYRFYTYRLSTINTPKKSSKKPSEGTEQIAK